MLVSRRRTRFSAILCASSGSWGHFGLKQPQNGGLAILPFFVNFSSVNLVGPDLKLATNVFAGTQGSIKYETIEICLHLDVELVSRPFYEPPAGLGVILG